MIGRIALGSVALAVALAGCTVERQVLGEDNAPLTTCDQVWLSGAPGDPCALSAPCTRNEPNDPMCCTAYAYCRMGELVMDTTCNPDCSTCVDDHDCVPGAAVCNGVACEPCAFTDPTGMTCNVTCPDGWVTLTRNGCATCECAPRSECSPNTGDCDAMGVPGDECYPGALFAPGCAPDDPGCTANVCSAPGCQGPAPLGCFTACDAMTMPSCQQCATTACECDPNTGGWSCQSICIDQMPLSLTCFL